MFVVWLFLLVLDWVDCLVVSGCLLGDACVVGCLVVGWWFVGLLVCVGLGWLVVICPWALFWVWDV